MTKEEIEAIIEKYRKRSQNVRFYGEENVFSMNRLQNKFLKPSIPL